MHLVQRLATIPERGVLQLDEEERKLLTTRIAVEAPHVLIVELAGRPALPAGLRV